MRVVRNIVEKWNTEYIKKIVRQYDEYSVGDELSGTELITETKILCEKYSPNMNHWSSEIAIECYRELWRRMA